MKTMRTIYGVFLVSGAIYLYTMGFNHPSVLVEALRPTANYVSLIAGALGVFMIARELAT
jgi:hypothetical protein